MNLILGSSSPRRLELLKSINIQPKKILSPDIDEMIYSNEHPLDYCKRIALKKLQKLILNNRGEAILSADTIVYSCLLYTSPSPRDGLLSRMPSSA